MVRGSVFWGEDNGVWEGTTEATQTPPEKPLTTVAGAIAGVAAESRTRGLRVYFVQGGREIDWIDRDLSLDVRVAYAPEAPFGNGDIALDGDRIYFSAPALGKICWIAKPP